MTSTSSQPPKAKALGTHSNGILPISASATQQRAAPSLIIKPSNRVSTSRLKVVARNLPPNLTLAEFEAILGEEWKVNGRRVDWFSFKPGKVSKNPGKHSTSSRAYIRLTKEEYIRPLSDKVREATFTDIKGRPKEPATSGPLTVVFAPYGRIPNGRGRKDLRQGTIDQDQEFKSFLQSLTVPIDKPAPVDQGSDPNGKSKEKVTVTPLVQFLKEKKVNKSKDIASTSKSIKHARQDSKDSTNGPVLDKRPPSKTGNQSSLSTERQNIQAVKIEKATREVVQVIQQKVAEVNKSPLPSPANPSVEKTPIVERPTPVIEKKRERGSASAAAKILQRDLGLGTSPRGRGGRRRGSSTTPKPTSSNITPTMPQEESASSIAPKESATITHVQPRKETPTLGGPSTATFNSQEPSTSPQPPKGPAASRASPKVAPASDAKPPPQNPSKKPNKDAPVSPKATQAFLKHANLSQGITEALLEEAFAVFGVVEKVEIDKKKGFGYVDFTEPKGLQEAVKASPVTVAQGQVVVLERRIGPTPARNARGGSSLIGNRGGSPIGPRGGRGGAIRRGGGAGRGGANNSNSNLSKGAAAGPPANPAKVAEAPAVSLETTLQNVSEAASEPTVLPTPTSKSASDAPDALGSEGV